MTQDLMNPDLSSMECIMPQEYRPQECLPFDLEWNEGGGYSWVP